MLRRSSTSRGLRAATVAGAACLIAALAPASAQAQGLGSLNTPEVTGSLEQVAGNEALPEQVRSGAERALGFLRGDGEPDEDGVQVPDNAPHTVEFLFPTVMNACIDGQQNAVGLATAVPGPAPLPVPGVPEHQVAFIFTALGTGPVAEHQAEPLVVDWFNPANGRRGSTELVNMGINPDGPTTVAGIADTGAGQVLAVLRGGVTTAFEDGTANCRVSPTVGIIPVG